MKHHVHTLILLASLTITWLLCSCRTTYQKDRSAQEQSNLSISDSTLYDRTGDIYSRFNFNKEEADKGWKIKVNFDTSKATNPATGLPPISDIEIEARRISKPCYKKMTLYTYLRSKRRKLISRFSKTAN